jgi:hypothetical protein
MSEQRNEIPANDPTQEPLSSGTGTDAKPQQPKEIGGPKGPEPTRYGDWEKNGRCIDF